MSTQNDLINYQNVIKEANSLINEQIKLWGGVVNSIQQVGKVTPSSFVNTQKQVNEVLTKNVEIQTKIDGVEKKRQATAQQILTTGAAIAKQKRDEIAQEERKSKALERATQRALEQNRAYQRLQTSWRNAQKALQDSIVTDGLKAKSTQRLQREFNELDKRIRKVDAATRNYSKNVGNYQSAMGGLGGFASQLSGALGIAGGIYGAVQLGREVYKTTKQLDLINKSMNATAMNAEHLAANMAFLNRVTEASGLRFTDAAIAFNKFYAASKDKLSLNEIHLIFDKISKAAALMGMSVHDQNLIFLALEQMMSKGKVSSEELRRQLGERLPAALDIMAKATGVTTAELDEMMRKGELISSEVLPKFAIEVEKAFGAESTNKVENMAAAENRLSNAWTKFIQEIDGSDNAIGNFAIKFMESITKMIGGVTRLSSSWERLHKVAGESAETSGYNDIMELYADFDQYENSRNSALKARQKYLKQERDLQEDIKKAQKELAAAEERRIMPNWLGGGAVTRDANRNLEELNRQLGNVQGRIKAVNDLWEDFNKEEETVTATETEAERNKRLAAEKKAAADALKYSKDLLKSQYDLSKVRLERQKADAKHSEDMEAYFTKEMELANLDYEYKKKLTNLEIKDKKRLAVELDRLQEEYTLRIEAIGRSEISQQEEVFKKLSDGIKKFYEFKQKEREEDEKKRQEGLRNEYDLTQIQNEIDLESVGGNRGGKYWETRQKEIDDWYKYQQELHKNNAQELLRIDKEYELQSIQLLNDRKNAFKQAMTEMYSSALGDMGAGSLAQFFNGQFEEIWAGAESLQEKMASVMMAIGDIASDVFKAMSESQNAYFQQQFQNLETEKDLALQFAGENTAGREAIEKQYEEKKRSLQMQQAKQQKQMAMIQATINIAQGITSALAQAPPYSFILAALVGVLGAVQLAKISSTPLPQFYTGTSNAPEGLALTQERGAEMITDKHGNIKTLGNNKGAQLTYLNKGDKVFTADETTQKLNELLISSGVSPIVNVSGGSGMSKEDMREVLNDTLAKQPKNSITFDENGIKAFTSKENRRTILKNRNVRI